MTYIEDLISKEIQINILNNSQVQQTISYSSSKIKLHILNMPILNYLMEPF